MNTKKILSLVLGVAVILFLRVSTFIPPVLTAALILTLAACGGAALYAGGGSEGRNSVAGILVLLIMAVVVGAALFFSPICFLFGAPYGTVSALAWLGVGLFIIAMRIISYDESLQRKTETVLTGALSGLIVLMLIVPFGVGAGAVAVSSVLAGLGSVALYLDS